MLARDQPDRRMIQVRYNWRSDVQTPRAPSKRSIWHARSEVAPRRDRNSARRRFRDDNRRDDQLIPASSGAHNQQFMEEGATLEIADITAYRPSRSRAVPEEAPVRLLSLDGRWLGCQARHYGGALLMSDGEEVTSGGMSGSPILKEDWRAIGVVCAGTSGPHARLMRGLPGRLLRELERPNDETEPAGPDGRHTPSKAAAGAFCFVGSGLF